MKDLPIQAPVVTVLEFDLPPGAPSLRQRSGPGNSGFAGTRQLLSEPSSGYHRGKLFDAMAKPAAEPAPYPFRKDLLWKGIIEDLLPFSLTVTQDFVRRPIGKPVRLTVMS